MRTRELNIYVYTGPYTSGYQITVTVPSDANRTSVRPAIVRAAKSWCVKQGYGYYDWDYDPNDPTWQAAFGGGLVG